MKHPTGIITIKVQISVNKQMDKASLRSFLQSCIDGYNGTEYHAYASEIDIHEDWDSNKFLEVTGRLPEDDDLERVNCRHAGTVGHSDCGVCDHGKPHFTCGLCFGTANVSTHA